MTCRAAAPPLAILVAELLRLQRAVPKGPVLPPPEWRRTTGRVAMRGGRPAEIPVVPPTRRARPLR